MKLKLFPRYGLANWATRFNFSKYGIKRADLILRQVRQELTNPPEYTGSTILKEVRRKYEFILEKDEPETYLLSIAFDEAEKFLEFVEKAHEKHIEEAKEVGSEKYLH